MKMINLSELDQVYIVCGKIDMRRGIDSLSIIIKEDLEHDPIVCLVMYFYFVVPRRITLKLFIETAFWLLYKRFENGKLRFGLNNQDEVRKLSSTQVSWLMKGFSIQPKINQTIVKCDKMFKLKKNGMAYQLKNAILNAKQN